MRGILIAALLAGCGSAEPEQAGPGATEQCSAASWSGVYFFTYAETSGNCGPIAPESAELSDGYPELPAGCVLERNEWAAGCVLERRVRCATSYGESLTEGTWYEAASDGAALAGDFLSRRTSAWQIGCLGTFSFTAIRQGH